MSDQENPNNRVLPGFFVRAWLGIAASVAVLQGAFGSPLIPPGDTGLRADIQLLADYGIISGPVTSWPLTWGPILADIEEAGRANGLPSHVMQALARVREEARWETQIREVRYSAQFSGAEKPSRIRSFADTPRESAQVGAGLSWTGNWLTIDLHGQLVSSPDDGDEFRADSSMISVLLGNYAVAVSTMDRWWGPGWDGSLILSSNARPIPAITIDRNFATPFETRWLSWLGPWDFSLMFGQMEKERVVPEAQFFGLRFNFRPFSSLEIGLSRTGQWCGAARPCGLDTFADLLVGKDNLGDSGIGVSNEPGNQLAGVDFRWSLARFNLPVAVYGQFIGEDEAGGFPSRYLGQLGAEFSGHWGERRTYRWFGEVADTSCGFYESEGNFDCAYNHGTYGSGYRYRGRTIGHGVDNDARVVSTGLMLMDEAGTRWGLLARYGELNRGGQPDIRNSLAATKRSLASFDVTYSWLFRYGMVEIGAGIERIESSQSAQTNNDVRTFLQWRSSR